MLQAAHLLYLRHNLRSKLARLLSRGLRLLHLYLRGAAVVFDFALDSLGDGADFIEQFLASMLVSGDLG